MQFADIHNHMLFGVDDGAKSQRETEQLIEASYADGVRHLCFTPHYHPAYFGEHQEKIACAFDYAKTYAATHFADLQLYLGSELRYERSCVEWVGRGKCRTLNDSDYLLVDFLYGEHSETILDAMLRVLNAGYTPVLAHVERYEKISHNLREIEQMKAWGVILQVDAQSVLGRLGYGSKIRARRLLAIGAIDVIASDAHDLVDRPPQLRACYDYVAKKYSEDYARHLFWTMPLRIIGTE